MKIDPSGGLLHSFIDLNNLALARFYHRSREARFRAHFTKPIDLEPLDREIQALAGAGNCPG